MSIEITKRPEISDRFAAFNHHDIRRAFTTAFSEAADITWLRPKGPGDKLLAQVDLSAHRVNLPELGGDLMPRVWLRSSNEGDQALTVGVGLYRFVCMNGLYLGLNVFSAKIRHVWGQKAFTSIQELPERLSEAARFVAEGRIWDAPVEALETPVIDPIAVVGNLPDVGLRTKDLVIDQIITGNHRAVDNPHNAWGLYNMVNEAGRKTGRSLFRQATNDIKILDNILILGEDQAAA